MKVIKESKQIKDLADSEIESVLLLAKTYYVNAKDVVNIELEHNTVIYLLKDNGGNILCFFDRLNIEDSKGDRLLITCEIPSKLKLASLKSKLVNFYI